MQIKHFLLGIFSFGAISFLSIDSTNNSTEPYFYEYGGYDDEGNEITVSFMTKTGYDSLIVPTNNDTLVNFLLQLQENNNQLEERIETLENANTSNEVTGDIDMQGFSILNAGNVETKLFTAKPIQ